MLDKTDSIMVFRIKAENEALKTENKEYELVFDAQWAADQRAIKMWREANPGNDLVWPDGAKLSLWLMEQLEQAKQYIDPEQHPEFYDKLTDVGTQDCLNCNGKKYVMMNFSEIGKTATSCPECQPSNKETVK